MAELTISFLPFNFDSFTQIERGLCSASSNLQARASIDSVDTIGGNSVMLGISSMVACRAKTCSI